MKKLWGGRFQEAGTRLLDEFNASIPFDYKLWRYDIAGSKVHAKMLHKIGVLSLEEMVSIHQGLDAIAGRIERGEFVFDISDEDIHMAIESALIAEIGEVGKKLHTARSRNDQVALDFRLYVLEENKNIQNNH